MIAQENAKVMPIASMLVDQALNLAGALSHGDEDFAAILQTYVTSRSKLLASGQLDPHVFVCHSSSDKQLVRKLANDIALEGYRI